MANGVLKVTGALTPASYIGAVPLSDLSAAPSLAVTVHARDGFIWALLVTFIGALIGGFWYLASSRRRRKDLLKAYLLDLLDRYSKRLATLRRGHGDTQAPVWNLDDYLGKRTRWFSVKWSAAPELDGVGGIWSTVFWARNDADLDQANAMVGAFRQRVVRWLRVADAVSALREVGELHPADPTNRRSWLESNTVKDTELLLGHLRSIEPPDDATTAVLLDRIKRQARWHAALALTWHMKSRVEAFVAAHPNPEYARRLGDMDLEALDQDASPEATRTDEQQFPKEQQLDRFQAELSEIYKGPDRQQLVMGEREGSPTAVELGQFSAEQVRPRSGTLALWAPSAAVRPSEAVTTSKPRRAWQVRDAARRAVSRPDRVGQAGTIIRALARRDLLWTLMIALVATAAYIPLFYDSTWGSLGDYGSAFAAGFLGKAVINWALLPAFQSLGLTSAGGASVTKPPAGSSAGAEPSTTGTIAAPAAGTSTPATSSSAPGGGPAVSPSI